MKAVTCLASLLLASPTALGAVIDGFRLQTDAQGLFSSIQDRLQSGAQQLIGEIKPAARLTRNQASSIVAQVAQELGASPKEVPSAAVDAWYDVLKDNMDALEPMIGEIAKQLTGKVQKASSVSVDRLSAVDWMHVTTNDKLPDYRLTAKDPKKLQVDNVKQYSGYISKEDEDKHFFYWFFESRNDPKNDPIVLWLNGGPGCSSLTGLFFELGPASIDQNIKIHHNPYSWNSNASVIFLDQPVNTGYSYSSSSKVSDTETAAEDVYAFLSLFFETFPEYNKGQKFHIAGESYAGHYIPVMAMEILSHEDRGFNLSSVLIGNGLTDPLRQYDYYEPMACGMGGAPSVLEPQQCESMLDASPRCDNLIKACYASESAWTCVPATIYCNNAMIGPYQQTGLNVYDIRSECEPDSGSLCYKGLSYIEAYLNEPEVKNALGAEVSSYEGCNFDVNREFLFKGDWMQPFYTKVTDLLELDLPVLIYAGDKDYICNWLGNEAWARELDWSGHAEFQKAEVKPWKTKKGVKAGTVQNYDKFTFLRVFEAGHMVPFNQPENSLDMLNRWMAGDFAFA